MKINDNKVYYIFLILIIGIACFLRIDYFLLADGIHSDEARLALNILDRNYIDLFKPLDYIQVAPPLFLVFSKFIHSISQLHNTCTTSDLALRFLPLCAGIVGIPAFGYLLNTIFKNKKIALLGMLLVAFNPIHICYSGIFKQYTLEFLITVLILIIFTKIDFEGKNLKHNLFLFSLLGLSLFFSMTAIYIILCGYLYLIFKDKHISKNLLFCTSLFLAIFLIYFHGYFHDVLKTSYIDLQTLWSHKTFCGKNFFNFVSSISGMYFRTGNIFAIISLNIIFAASFVFMILKKNIKTICFGIIPFFILYLLVISDTYPLLERLFLFSLPCYMIILLYPISLIPHDNEIYKPRIFYTILVVFSLVLFNYKQPKMFINPKVHQSKILWNYFLRNYKNDGSIIIVKPTYSILYYMKISQFKDKFMFYKDFENLPKGISYILAVNYSEIKNDLSNYKEDLKIYKIYNFSGRTVYGNRLSTKALYIKLEK